MDNLTNIEVYLAVKNGRIKRFPSGFWHGADGDIACREIIKYLLFVELQYSDSDILSDFNAQLLKRNKLLGMLSIKFNGIAFDCLDFVFPGKFKFWQMKKSPSGYWNLETAKTATIWLIEEHLCWSKEKVMTSLNKDVFIKNYLGGLMSMDEINGSTYKALVNAYGDDYIKPWELSMAPMCFWSASTCADAIHWLVDTHKFTKVELLCLTEQDFINYNIHSVYSFFNDSLIKILENAYPNEYKKIGHSIYYLPDMICRKSLYANNTSGHTGVMYDKSRKKWTAIIQNNNNSKHIGQFSNLELAINARHKKELELIKEAPSLT